MFLCFEAASLLRGCEFQSLLRMSRSRVGTNEEERGANLYLSQRGGNEH